jgi:hypothetical protein
MSKLESNIKHIQQFVNLCIQRDSSSYSYSFSVKRELLNVAQGREAAKKELERISDELMLLHRQNPILQSLANHIEIPDFLWDSAFIETLSSHEKKKYMEFNVSLLDAEKYKQDLKQYDEQLPYLSAIINYGVLNRYASYLKTFIPVPEIENIEKSIEEVIEKPKVRVLPVSEPQNLEVNFDKNQIEILTQCINELKIFTTPITVTTMKNIFSCKLKEPLKIGKNKNKLLAYFFSVLDNRSLITREWQSVCAKNTLFLSSGKGVVMQQGNFSSAVAQNNEFPPKDCHIIDNYIKQLKRD